VLVVGGGTAGYFAALAFQRHTAARVRLVESKALGHIGVGEATVPSIVPFLHSYLGIDTARFYADVRPTWKLGIKFVWGQPAPYRFLAPFDWGVDSIGALGSFHERGNLDEMSIMALLMDEDKVPLFALDDGRIASMLLHLPVAYHFDVSRLIAFLARLADERGVEHVDAVVQEVQRGPTGDIAAVVTDAGPLHADFFVDCSGFRSLILGQTLGSPFVSFDASLFTDSALAFEIPHGGHIKPYTTATTMECGWTWTIPQQDDDHCGYVFSSKFCTPEQAEAELVRRFGVPNRVPRLVRFRSGRREHSWIRNAAAIGNASGFVEPLESTGLLMTTESIRLLVDGVNASADWSRAAQRYNVQTAATWDGLRWFLSLHYKFNAALDTTFWHAAREDTDISGLAEVVDEFKAYAPLRSRDTVAIRGFDRLSSVLFYGVPGIDCILFGQKVPARVIPSLEDHTAWRDRRDTARRLVKGALSMRQALDVPDLPLHHRAAGKISDDFSAPPMYEAPVVAPVV
jgi:tryptophan halogenase